MFSKKNPLRQKVNTMSQFLSTFKMRYASILSFFLHVCVHIYKYICNKIYLFLNKFSGILKKTSLMSTIHAHYIFKTIFSCFLPILSLLCSRNRKFLRKKIFYFLYAFCGLLFHHF